MSRSIKKQKRVEADPAVVRVYGYARVSTDVQFEKGASLETQVELIKQYCLSKNIELVNVWTEGISGAVPPDKRPILSAIMKGFREGKANTLCVIKIDRFSRSVRDFTLTMDEFRKLGVNFCSVTEDINTTTAMGRFFFGLMQQMSQMERELIGERIQLVMEQKKAAGELYGTVPWGKRVVVVGEKKMLVRDDEEMETLRLTYVFREKMRPLLKGGEVKTQLAVVAHQLMEAKRKNKEGECRFHLSQIRHMLNTWEKYEKEKCLLPCTLS